MNRGDKKRDSNLILTNLKSIIGPKTIQDKSILE
jgi:hypothetical protein